jgi:hypothetical protein
MHFGDVAVGFVNVAWSARYLLDLSTNENAVFFRRFCCTMVLRLAKGNEGGGFFMT